MNSALRFCALLAVASTCAFAGSVPVNTPEPTTMLTVGAGVIAVVALLRKRRDRK